MSYAKLTLFSLVSLILTGNANAQVGILAGANDQSLFYDFNLVAQTGSQFNALADAVSINRAGQVAFQGQDSAGQGIYVWSGSTTVDAVGSFHSTNRAFGRAVELNNNGFVIGSDRVSGAPPFTFVRAWRVATPGSFTTLARGGAGQSYDSVFSHPALADSGAWALTALRGSDRFLFTPVGETQLLGNLGNGYRPSIADNGSVVLHDANAALEQIQLYGGGNPANLQVLAGRSSFLNLGNQPGISRSGVAVAFAGDRGNGPGVFVSIADDSGVRHLIRVAGEGAGAQTPQPDLGYTPTDSSGVDQPIFFSAIDTNSRVSVEHWTAGATGITDDVLVVSFIGTPSDASTYPRFGYYPGLFFRKQPGLWTVRLEIKRNAPFNVTKQYALPVAQVGDKLSLNGATVVIQNLAIHDPLAIADLDDNSQPLTEPLGSHRLAFWVNDAGGKQYVVRASHLNSCLTQVRHYSQCDSRWSGLQFINTGNSFCNKACALSSSTMAADTAAQRFSLLGDFTPKDTYDFVLPRGGFSGSSVHWLNLVQALRQAGGTFDGSPVKADGSVAIPKFSLLHKVVSPTSNAIQRAAGMSAIRASLCSLTEPAPLLVGVDREPSSSTNVVAPGHFILVSGTVNNRYFISDPGYMNGVLFSQGNASNSRSTVYQNDFETRGSVIDPPTVDALGILTDHNVDLALTSNSGQVTSYDSASGNLNEGIPNSVLWFEAIRDLNSGAVPSIPATQLLIDHPVDASYRLALKGLASGPVSVRVLYTSPNGVSSPPLNLQTNLLQGQTQQFEIRLPASPGSIPQALPVPTLLGDFDGDNDVDLDDLAILNANLNRSVAASTCGAACDLVPDGRINVSDSRKLVTLCTRSRCATH